MKLDVNALRYLSREDFRVLTAIEMGQKNHEIVPVELIDTIAGLKHSGTFRHLGNLAKAKLVHHDASKYNGYRLTSMGYDFLAIRTLLKRGVIASVGRQIGVGKESDVFEVMNEDGEVLALKLHRLGRTSFRAVKNKRDYLRSRTSFSWLYLSRLSALKEFAFMRALGRAGLPVPVAVDHNRHAVLMSLVDATPLVQVRELHSPGVVYGKLMDLVARLAELGLVHCDFNEFNVLVDDNDEVTLIDFPQMISVSHANAKELFDRDVDCLIRFFKKKLGYIPEHDPSLASLRPDFEAIVAHESHEKGLDEELAASGFQSRHQAALDRFQLEAGSESADSSDDDNDAAEGSGREEEVSRAAAAIGSSCGGGAQPCSDVPAAPPPARTDELPPGLPAELTAGQLTSACRIESGSDAESEDASTSASDRDAEDSAAAEQEPASHEQPRVRDRVRRRVTEQRQHAARRGALVHASRNAQKAVSRKGRNDVNASRLLG